MKKRIIVITIVVILLLFSSCQNKNELQQTEIAENKKQDVSGDETFVDEDKGFTEICGYTVYVGYRKFSSEDFNFDIGVYEGDVIPNEETAICVAKQIFEGRIDKPKAYDGFEPVALHYDKSSGIWVVMFKDPAEFTPEYMTPGGGFNIAIQQEDGRVLKMWADE